MTERADGRPAGHVLLLNGAPSSGKTTIARALWEELEPPHWYRSLDDFRKGYLDRHFDPARGPWWRIDERPLFFALLDGYLRSLRAMALAGHHVIAEAVILPKTRDLYLDALGGLPVFLVGVRCPVDVAERRERARTDRPGSAPIELRVPEFDLVHSHGAYDVEVDTSTTSVAVAVASIRRALASPPTAFQRILARRPDAAR